MDLEAALQLNSSVHQYLKRTFCNPESLSELGEEDCESRFVEQLRVLTKPPMCSILRMNTRNHGADDIQKQVRCAVAREDGLHNRINLSVDRLPVLPDVLFIPHTGPHSREQLGAEVIVGAACGMAVLRGADVFAPGIVGAPTYVQAGDQVSVYADLEGTCLRGYTKPFVGRKLYLGNGIMKISRSDLFCTKEKISGLGILMTSPVYEAPSLTGLLPDLVFPQNLPSVVCGHLLGAQAGDHVLDMCAAPGGKTTHIATLMDDTGVVIALDKSKNKLAKIKENADNFGLTCIQIYGTDATKAHDENAGTSGPPPYPSACFDRILLDAPCSALGQRPSFCNSMELPEVKSFPVLQRKLFEKAVKLLKPGGTLVYSTCTITLEENEEQIAWALSKFQDMQLVEPTHALGGAGLRGAGLSDTQRKMVQRFGATALPNPEQTWIDTIGFFCAKFIKL